MCSLMKKSTVGGAEFTVEEAAFTVGGAHKQALGTP